MGSSRRSLLLSRWTTSSPSSPLSQQLNRIKLVTLCYGANDASISPRNPGWRMVPVDEYKANLLETINIFRAANNATNILLITPPPAVAPPRIDRSLAVTAEYAEACKQVGLEMNVPVVDIFNSIQAVPGWEAKAILKDGLHLTPAGNQVVYEGVKAAIRANFQDLSKQA